MIDAFVGSSFTLKYIVQNAKYLGLLQCGFWMLFKKPFPEFLLLAHLQNVSQFLFKVIFTDINVLMFINKQQYP
jgi:hypothetical protein